MVGINDNVECCGTCKHRIDYPKHNAYGDVDHLCAVTSYFVHAIWKDRHKVKRYSPGGKELVCRYEKESVCSKILYRKHF